jgi:hypothetical protein
VPPYTIWNVAYMCRKLNNGRLCASRGGQQSTVTWFGGQSVSHKRSLLVAGGAGARRVPPARPVGSILWVPVDPRSWWIITCVASTVEPTLQIGLRGFGRIREQKKPWASTRSARASLPERPRPQPSVGLGQGHPLRRRSKATLPSSGRFRIDLDQKELSPT